MTLEFEEIERLLEPEVFTGNRAFAGASCS